MRFFIKNKCFVHTLFSDYFFVCTVLWVLAKYTRAAVWYECASAERVMTCEIGTGWDRDCLQTTFSLFL